MGSPHRAFIESLPRQKSGSKFGATKKLMAVDGPLFNGDSMERFHSTATGKHIKIGSVKSHEFFKGQPRF